MSAGVWDSYEKNREEVESRDRGPVTSELETSDTGLREIEQALGFSVEDAFDSYRSGEESDTVGGGTHAAAGTENGEVVLEAFRDAPLSSLAHESVHGIIRQPDTDAGLPDSEAWDQTVYEEFVARKAESQFEDLDVSEAELRKLSDSRKAYEEARDEYSEFFPDEKLDLNQEIGYVEAIEDQEINDELYQKADTYREDRNSVLAKEAARRHDEDIEVSELVNPDPETYQETLQHIKNVDDKVFSKYQDEA